MTSLNDSSRPWLEIANLRVRTAERETFEPLSLEASGARVGLVGDFRPLFAALDRSATITSGYGNIAGDAIELAVRNATVGLARANVPLPPTLSALEYLTHSARLAGQTKASASQAARRVLADLGLAQLSSRRLSTLTAYEQRALLIAHAGLTSPPVVCLETPLARLDPASQNFLRAVIERAGASRRLLVSIYDLSDPFERDLLNATHEAFARNTDGIVTPISAHTLTSSGRNFSVVVTRNAEALVSALSEHGVRARITGDAGLLRPLLHAESQASAARLSVELPADAEPALIVEVARATESLVIELIPGF